MRTAKIDVTKIDKAKLFKGAKGTYLDIVLIEKPDDFGNDGFIAQSVTKEERESGVKGEIIGNWKRVGQKKAPAKKPAPQSSPEDEGDDDLPW